MAPPFIPYYIDYNIKNQSKTIGVSKKKITFKFGFANRQAIEQGLVGAHCRGSEHECIFTWSLNSGKRHVSMDGKDVHFSTSGQNGWTSDRTWQHVFSLKVPGYSGTFRCHLISQPAPQGSNVRPFDLRVGGVSIFKFNQIFQLGTQQMVVRKPGGGRATYNGSGEEDEPMSPEERRMLAAARLESMKDYREQQAREAAAANSNSAPASAPAASVPTNGGATGGGDLLMSFDTPSAAPPVPAPQAQGQMVVSSLTIGSDFGGSTTSFPPAPAPGQQPFGYPQQPPQQPQANPFAAAPPPALPYGSPAALAPQQSFGGGSATTAPTANTTAMTPYQAPAGQAPASQFAMRSSFTASVNSFGTAPTQASTQASLAASLDPYAAAPADPFASPAAPAPAMNSYGQLPPSQPPQQQLTQYGGGYPAQQPPNQFGALQSPTGETQASFGTYGSTPSFARPPPAGAPGQPQYPPAGGYGQAHPPPAGAYAPPPQYQQQQYQQPGF